MTHHDHKYPAQSRIQDSPEVRELLHVLTSRICHDLASPLGAIANGVELLAMTQGNSTETALLAESVGAANARIRVFRVAFGPAPSAQMMSPAEIASLLKDYAQSSRFYTVFDMPDTLPRAQVQLVVLTLMCLESALPWGGNVQVRKSGTTYTITADADRLRIEPEHWAWLHGQADPCNPAPATLQFTLLALLLQAQQHSFQMQATDHDVQITMAPCA